MGHEITRTDTKIGVTCSVPFRVISWVKFTVLPDQLMARPTIATGMVSVPRRSGPLSTVAYAHGTSVSFYDRVSNPNIFGEFEERGESFEGPPSNSVFAGAEEWFRSLD